MAGNSRQVLRQRIRSIRETAKVTKAMELIASARMRRAEQRAVNARPYAARLGELMTTTLSRTLMGAEHPLLVRADDGPAIVVHFTTDKGLCGGLNLRLNHALALFVTSEQYPARVVTVGRKGRDFVLRAGLGLLAEFTELGDAPGIMPLRPLCRLLTDMFMRGEVDRVFLCYPQLVSAMTQRPVVERMLPVERAESAPAGSREVLLEPSPTIILDHLLARYVEASVYHAYLELVACEQSARMVAMHAATESATDLAEAMHTDLNKSRQAAITEEICDVSAGAEALSRGVSYE